MLTYQFIHRTPPEGAVTFDPDAVSGAPEPGVLGGVTVESLLELLCRIRWNSFTVTDPSLRALGKALVIGPPALLNHSCAPNAIVMFEGLC